VIAFLGIEAGKPVGVTAGPPPIGDQAAGHRIDDHPKMNTMTFT
jgi:hypothetical protein